MFPWEYMPENTRTGNHKIYWNVLPNTKLFSTLTSIPFLVVDECKHAYNNVYFDLVRCLLFTSGREVTFICVFVNFKILVY